MTTISIRWLAAPLVVGMALSSGDAYACQVGTPRCDNVNRLLERLSYREQLLTGQAHCRTKAAESSPEVLSKNGVFKVLGVKKGGPGWDEAMEAHDHYVSGACGGEEVVQLVLNLYRNAWLERLNDEQLKAIADGRAEVPQTMKSEVSRAAGVQARGMLMAMEAAARKDYEQEVKDALGPKKEPSSEGCGNGTRDAATGVCKPKK